MKKFTLSLLLVAFTFVLASCSSLGNTEKLHGVIEEVHSDSLLVKEDEHGNDYVVATGHLDDQDYQVGQKVTVHFDGKVAESLPPQILNASAIDIIDE